MESLNRIVKDIKLVARQSKKVGKMHFVRIEFINNRQADVWCDREVADLVESCGEMGVEAVKSFSLEKRISDKSGVVYTAIILTMFNDDVYYYFLPRATNTMVDLLVARTVEEAKAE